MNALQRLLSLSAPEKTQLGVEATPGEIAHQPEMWRDTAGRVAEAAPGLRAFLGQVGLPDRAAEVVFVGAGTSDFVGRCLEAPVSAALRTRALAVPSTSLVTHPAWAFPSARPAVMVSFARSSNSPESVAAMDLALALRPEVRHLVITCNAEGELAKRARGLGDQAFALLLHPRTNDRGLAMTSAFTSMVIAGLGLAYLDRVDQYLAFVDRAATAAERVLNTAPDIAESLAKRGPSRACFLGSGPLLGAATECHLKLQELTDGHISCFYDSFLGLRHGPRAALHEDTLVVCFLSSNPQVRRYELDLIRSNRAQGIGLAQVLVADRTDEELSGLADHVIAYDPDRAHSLSDAFAAPVVTILGQLLGLFASLALGFKPDTPSASGVISRVVQGVTIYPWKGEQL